MNKNVLLFLLIFAPIQISFAQNETENSIFYVINALGAKVYESPSHNSESIGIIGIGQEIIALEIIDTEESVVIGNGLSFSGDFVKVQTESTTGYIFSSDLTKIKPILRDVFEGTMTASLLGKEVSKKMETRIVKTQYGQYEVVDEITEFENGSYTYTDVDDCFDHVYRYKNLTLSEVYHQLTVHNANILITSSGNFIGIPEFHEKNGNEYHFYGEGSTQDLKIIDHEDGSFTISSYDCT